MQPTNSAVSIAARGMRGGKIRAMRPRAALQDILMRINGTYWVS
jgi:hypothetical protein